MEETVVKNVESLLIIQVDYIHCGDCVLDYLYWFIDDELEVQTNFERLSMAKDIYFMSIYREKCDFYLKPYDPRDALKYGIDVKCNCCIGLLDAKEEDISMDNPQAFREEYILPSYHRIYGRENILAFIKRRGILT